MKRIITIISCFIIILCFLSVFTSCVEKNNDNNNLQSDPQSEIVKNNMLVAYFSCTNNTKNVANKIATNLSCEIFEIVPSDLYTSEDLNYNNNNSRANKEQNNENVRPKIATSIDNIENYDVVFIGYPIWWGKLPKIIYTFCDTYDFSSKIIIPFCTSGSSGIETSVSELKALEPNATIMEGRRFEGNVSQSAINLWVESLNLSIKGEYKMNIYINDTKLTATMEDNSSAEALKELLKTEDLVINMHDYANFEKVGSLPKSLPRNDKQITTSAGDIILYQGNQITIYYDTNSWNFTKLGKINNITQDKLKTLLGKGDVEVRLSLS